MVIAYLYTAIPTSVYLSSSGVSCTYPGGKKSILNPYLLTIYPFVLNLALR